MLKFPILNFKEKLTEPKGAPIPAYWMSSITSQSDTQKRSNDLYTSVFHMNIYLTMCNV